MHLLRYVGAYDRPEVCHMADGGVQALATQSNTRHSAIVLDRIFHWAGIIIPS